MSARHLTLDELAELLGQSARRLDAILSGDVQRGIVEQDGAGYRLTAEAERLHGSHLRGIVDPGETA